MKKTYIAPASETIQIAAEGPLALSAGSKLNDKNQGLRPGEDNFNGEFNSNKQGWDASDWSDEE